MKADPILKELWEIKDGLAAECDHDLRRLFNKLKTSEKDHAPRLANRTKLNATATQPRGPSA